MEAQEIKINGDSHFIILGETVVKIKNDDSLYKINRVSRPNVSYYATNLTDKETSAVYIEDIIEVINTEKNSSSSEITKEKFKELVEDLEKTDFELSNKSNILERRIKKNKESTEKSIDASEKELLKALLKYSLSKIDNFIDSL